MYPCLHQVLTCCCAKHSFETLFKLIDIILISSEQLQNPTHSGIRKCIFVKVLEDALHVIESPIFDADPKSHQRPGTSPCNEVKESLCGNLAAHPSLDSFKNLYFNDASDAATI
jgi:hypothetical protein